MNSLIKATYIYIKEAKGVLYLGKTTQDPFLYRGSGLRWKEHLRRNKVRDSEIVTCILDIVYSREELIKQGIFYSEYLNVIDNPVWANLKLEEGDGGDTTSGRVWINNGENNFRVDRDSLNWYLNNGFYKGRLGMSEAQTGYKNHRWGKTKENSKSSIPVLQVDPKTEKVVNRFPSIKEATSVLGCSSGDISRCVNGKSKTVKGFKFIKEVV